jgi:predicted TIM-barrel fold metal-dependent hydrolase
MAFYDGPMIDAANQNLAKSVHIRAGWDSSDPISDICAYNPDWTVDSYPPIVLSLIDWFGGDRCVFARDFPVAALHGDFDAHYNAFKEIVHDFSATKQRQLFHDNAARLYRLG